MCSLALCDLISIILNIGCFAVGKFSVYYEDNILMFAIPYVIPLTQVISSEFDAKIMQRKILIALFCISIFHHIHVLQGFRKVSNFGGASFSWT